MRECERRNCSQPRKTWRHRYCSNACKQADYRDRKEAAAREAAAAEAAKWRPCPTCKGSGKVRRKGGR